MAQTMADRIAEARRQSFVGRTAERELFDRLLADDRAAVLFVHGPSGVGKSSLLRLLATRAAESGAVAVHIDARDIPPTREALGFRLQPAFASGDARIVVLMDHYELLAPIDGVLREDLALRLPGDVVLVLAGLHAPAPAWRTDPGWAPLLRTVRLSNLSRNESAAFLRLRGVPAERQAAAIDFTHGHPLALALVGEVVREKGEFAAADSADVVRVLLDRLLDAVPSSAHRTALEASSLVRVIDEALLAAMLGIQDATDLFSWMRRLPFVDAGPFGLYLHDLARDVLAADLRWRHARRHTDYHDRARQHYLGRLDNPDPMVQAAVLVDLIYLHPDLRQFLQAPDLGASLRVEGKQPTDNAAIEAMVRRHEGDESAEIAARWLAEQPAAWLIVRDRVGSVAGAVCLLTLEGLAREDPDPAVRAALIRLRTHPPLRPGERATLIRFWLSADDYQSVSPVQSLIATQLGRHYLTTPGLAVSILPFAHPEDWLAFCEYADQRPAPEADFTVGGCRYTAFDHDWRLVPPAAWVAQLSMREVGAAPAPTVAATPSVLVLGEAEFTAAVRQAFRDYSRPDRLRTNPLLKCRIVTSAVAASEPLSAQVAALQAAVKAATDTLSTTPADRRLHRVLVRAYLAPAPSLEKAAEVLELPSSTFRRLLTTAVGRVTTLLWYRELES